MSKPGAQAGDRNPAFRHGHSTRSNQSAEYRTWANMLLRCRNPGASNYAYYGGRGIRVCERWLTFENFFADVGPRPSAKHTLDRINSEGHYEPGNVRWATMKEQGRNTRRNHLITFGGETLCAAEWAERTGIDQIAIIKRLRRGWSVEDALTRPAGTRLLSRWTRAKAPATT